MQARKAPGEHRTGSLRSLFTAVEAGPTAVFRSFRHTFCLKIIRAEAESYGGLILTQEAAPELKNVKLPVTHIYSEPEKTKEKTVKGSLQTDGWDPDKRIAIEFVSKSDVGNWKETEEGVYATVEGYAIQDTAVRLQKSLEKASPEVVVGIFYDPYEYGDLIEEYDKIQKKYESR